MKKIILILFCILTFSCLIHAQEGKPTVELTEKNKGYIISIKNDKDITIYIDGKKYHNEVLNLIDISKIENVEALKGEKARSAYGVDRVVIITTNQKSKKNEKEIIDEKTQKKNSTAKLSFKSINLDSVDESKYPLILIDGKKSSAKDLKELDPIDISSIKVLKDDDSKKKYNTENGVIIVTAKKKKD